MFMLLAANARIPVAKAHCVQIALGLRRISGYHRCGGAYKGANLQRRSGLADLRADVVRWRHTSVAFLHCDFNT